MALLYKTTGEIKKVTPAGKKFTLAELQGFVGGYIEAVSSTKACAYCNEEGRLRKLPFNLAASVRFNMVLRGDVIELQKEGVEPCAAS